jgi:hypothetical protein
MSSSHHKLIIIILASILSNRKDQSYHSFQLNKNTNPFTSNITIPSTIKLKLWKIWLIVPCHNQSSNDPCLQITKKNVSFTGIIQQSSLKNSRSSHIKSINTHIRYDDNQPIHYQERKRERESANHIFEWEL